MKYFITVFGVMALVGCASSEHEDLKDWMARSNQSLTASIPPLPQVKPYEPVDYRSGGAVDPFSVLRLEPTAKSKIGKGIGNPFEPDFDARDLRNSLLEKYALESMKMIGYLFVANKAMAVVQVDNHVKQVKVGDYIGLDFGLVTKVTPTEVALRELFQDANGEWTERKSVLLLQAQEGGKK